MVNTDPSYRDQVPERGERAQLLLVGAIAIALVLIGLVVIFNTVLYTDATTPTETLEAADEAETLNQQVRNDTRTITMLVANRSTTNVTNVTNPALDNSTFKQNLEKNMTNYSRGLGQSISQTGPVFVNITVNEVGVNGVPVGMGSLGSCSGLCVNYTFTYSTEEFTYRRTQTVDTPPPAGINVTAGP